MQARRTVAADGGEEGQAHAELREQGAPELSQLGSGRGKPLPADHHSGRTGRHSSHRKTPPPEAFMGLPR